MNWISYCYDSNYEEVIFNEDILPSLSSENLKKEEREEKGRQERKKTKSAVLFTVLTNHFYAKRHQRKSLVQMTLSDVFSCLVHPINTE